MADKVKEELFNKVNNNAKKWIESNTPVSLRSNKEVLDFVFKAYVEGANDPDLIDYIENLCDGYRKKQTQCNTLQTQFNKLKSICEESQAYNDYLIQRVENQDACIKKQKDELDNFNGFVDDIKTYIL